MKPRPGCGLAGQPLPFAEEEVVRVIENVPGRLGGWPVNAAVARVGLPWKRRLSRAALYIPRIRYHEEQFKNLPDDALTARSMELRGKARGKWDLNKLLPEAFGLVSVAIQRTLGLR